MLLYTVFTLQMLLDDKQLDWLNNQVNTVPYYIINFYYNLNHNYILLLLSCTLDSSI